MSRVLLYGDLHPDRLGASYARAFIACGCRVHPIDVRAIGHHVAWWAMTRPGQRLGFWLPAVRRRATRTWNEAFLEGVRTIRPEIVILVGGTLLWRETVESARDHGAPIAVVHADDPLVGAWATPPEHRDIVGARVHHFLWSRSRVARLRERHGPQAHYLPFAWDPVVFPHRRSGKREAHLVIFVGGWSRRRERLLETVARHFDLKIWGPPYWRTRTRPWSRLRRCWQGRALAGEEAAIVIARAGVTLNVLRDQNLPDGTNMRTFEVPGCGGFLLADRSAGAAEILPEGSAAAYFDGPEELCERIDYYLTRPAERREIAEEAHRVVDAAHRYVHRAEAILRLLKASPQAASGVA